MWELLNLIITFEMMIHPILQGNKPRHRQQSDVPKSSGK